MVAGRPGAEGSPLTAPLPDAFTAEALLDAYPILSTEERLEGFLMLGAPEAADFFLALSTHDQVGPARGAAARSGAGRGCALLAPDDAADVLQARPAEDDRGSWRCWTPRRAREVSALLAYAEDAAGGLMNPRYARLRPDMTVDEAIRYLRRQAQPRHRDHLLRLRPRPGQQLLGVVSFRELFAAPPERDGARHHAAPIS